MTPRTSPATTVPRSPIAIARPKRLTPLLSTMSPHSGQVFRVSRGPPCSRAEGTSSRSGGACLHRPLDFFRGFYPTGTGRGTVPEGHIVHLVANTVTEVQMRPMIGSECQGIMPFWPRSVDARASQKAVNAPLPIRLSVSVPQKCRGCGAVGPPAAERRRRLGLERRRHCDYVAVQNQSLTNFVHCINSGCCRLVHPVLGPEGVLAWFRTLSQLMRDSEPFRRNWAGVGAVSGSI